MSTRQSSKFFVFATAILGLSTIFIIHTQLRADQGPTRSKEIVEMIFPARP